MPPSHTHPQLVLLTHGHTGYGNHISCVRPLLQGTLVPPQHAPLLLCPSKGPFSLSVTWFPSLCFHEPALPWTLGDSHFSCSNPEEQTPPVTALFPHLMLPEQLLTHGRNRLFQRIPLGTVVAMAGTASHVCTSMGCTPSPGRASLSHKLTHSLHYGKTIRATLLLSLQPSLFMRGLIKRFCGQLVPMGQFRRK